MFVEKEIPDSFFFFFFFFFKVEWFSRNTLGVLFSGAL